MSAKQIEEKGDNDRYGNADDDDDEEEWESDIVIDK